MAAHRTFPEEVPVPTHSSFRDELDQVNRELRKSLQRLQALLERKRRDLEETAILQDRREQEHLEGVIRDIEQKILELRAIGVPPSSQA